MEEFQSRIQVMEQNVMNLVAENQGLAAQVQQLQASQRSQQGPDMSLLIERMSEQLKK